jgi:glycosyltransferase involved in cell wall biosynthesis
MLRLLYIYSTRKRALLEAWRRGEQPDNLLFGYNWMHEIGVQATLHEPEYGPLGRQVYRLIGRLGPEAVQLRTLPLFPQHDAVFLTVGLGLALLSTLLGPKRPPVLYFNQRLTTLLRRGGLVALLVRLAAPRCDRIVCISRGQMRVLRERCGIPPERLAFVPLNIDAPFFTNDTPPHPDGPIVAVGRDPARDYRTFIEAVRSLRREVHIATSPERLAGIELPPHVVAHYNAPGTLVRELYRRASLVVIPTQLEDGQGTGSDISGGFALLEALCMNRPVIATRRESLADYVTEPEEIRTVPPRDPEALRHAIIELLHHPDDAAAMAARASARVRSEYTSRRFAERIAALAAEAAGRPLAMRKETC